LWFESPTVTVSFNAPARTTTPIQSPTVLFEGNARVDDIVVPASLLACCIRAIPAPEPVTVKVIPLLGVPLTVTTTVAAPAASPLGTGAVMLVVLQFVGVDDTPLNVTVLVPWDVPKFVPVIVTGVPAGPVFGFTAVIAGGTERLNVTVLSVLVEAVFPTPLAVTTPAGIDAVTVPDWVMPLTATL
jgi:hypothetical protein